MKVSTRPGTMNGMPALFVYRPRQRSIGRQSLAHAVETKSGRWIVWFGYNQTPDVAEDMAAAETMLHEFFGKLGSH